jgi:tetratricopeptide (TPR) repeat protein
MKKRNDDVLEESERRLLRVVESDPNDQTAWYELGQLYNERQDYAKAHSCFNKALDIEPDNPYFKRAIIEVLLSIGDIESAEKNLCELSEKSHERGSVETLLRVVKFLQGERDALKDTLVEVEGDPTDPRCWLYRAQELLETDRLKEAEAAAIRGTMANTETDLRTLSDLWETIGHILYRMERPRDGVEAYLVAFGLDHCSSAAASLAKALSESGLHEQAQRVLEKAVEDGTEISEVFILLGMRYWDIDRRHDARRMYRRATELAPENMNWAVPYVHLLIDLGEFDEAQKELERIKAVGSDHRYADYYAEVLRSRREELSDDLVIVRASSGQLPRLVRDAGFISDWIHREVEGVDTVFTSLSTRARVGLSGHYCVTGIDVCVDGKDLQHIRRQIQERLEKRGFMYSDYDFEFKDTGRLGLPRVVLSIRLRPRRYLTNDEFEHKGKVSPELKEYIEGLLKQASSRTHMSSVVECFLTVTCKCEQLEHAINLIESVMTWDDHDPIDLLAAEACLRSLGDLRVGAGLLWLWQNRDALRSIWRQHSRDDREFVSQIYEWFMDLRYAKCNTLCMADSFPVDANAEQIHVEGEMEGWLSNITSIDETERTASG